MSERILVLRPVLHSQKYEVNSITSELIQEILSLTLHQYADVNFKNKPTASFIEQTVIDSGKREVISLHFDTTAVTKRAYHNRVFSINNSDDVLFGTVVITGEFDYIKGGYLGLSEHTLKFLLKKFRYPQNIYYLDDVIFGINVKDLTAYSNSILVLGNQNNKYDQMLKYPELSRYYLFGDVAKERYETFDQPGMFKFNIKYVTDPIDELIKIQTQSKLNNNQDEVYDTLAEYL